MQNNYEHRRRERKPIEQQVVVYDSILNNTVGQLVNAHDEGFMLISDGEVRENCLYQLVMKFAETVRGVDHISVGAECLWLRETDTETQYWAGFHIVDIGDKERDILLELTE